MARQTALITGASRGLVFALAEALPVRGWPLILDGRDAATLETARAALAQQAVTPNDVIAIPGDVTDTAHRDRLAAAVKARGLDLLVNNASTLGTSPLPSLLTFPLHLLEAV